MPRGDPAPDFAPDQLQGENLYTGSIVEPDARRGAYKGHIKIVPKDWHDWDVSAAPVITSTALGRRVLIEAPKDRHLYAFDLVSQQPMYRGAVARVKSADSPFDPGKAVHFCPGSTDGAEWNGPAYDPQNNLVTVDELD